MTSTIANRFYPKSSWHSDAPFPLHDMTVYPAKRVVKVQGRDVRLTKTEFNLLLFLASKPGQVCQREELMREVWDYAQVVDCSTVTVHVQRLRKKLEVHPGNPKHIKTVWGEGYKFEASALDASLESLNLVV